MTHTAPTHLAIIERGFRGILEEQYGHIFWLSLILRGMKVPLDIVLCRSAARLALQNHLQPECLVLSTGANVFISNPVGALASFLESGGRVFVIEADIAVERNSSRHLLPGVISIDRTGVADLITSAGKVWFW